MPTPRHARRIASLFVVVAALAGFMSGCGSSAVTRATRVGVICTPSAASPGESIHCSANVSNFGARGGSFPMGTVTFSVAPTGSLASRTCALRPGTTFSTCAVPFTSGAGRQTVTAGYAGDKSHKKSTGETTVTVLGPTRAAVACPLAPTSASREITCTATVDDAGSGAATAPIGSVTFAAVPAGTFAASGVCMLSPAGSHARCQVSYRPVAGRQKISVSYAGDAVHAMSTASTIIAGRYATHVVVSCAPSPVPAGHTTSCEAIVTDVGAGTAPTGSVLFTATPRGSFTSSGTCAPASSGNRRSCKVVYTPTGGEQTVTATYIGDTRHEPSHGVTKVSAPSPTALTLTCTPAQVSAERPIACTAVVRDAGAGKAPRPTGTISFSALPAGSFAHGHTCTLASAACTVTYKPLVGQQTITATYGGDNQHDHTHSTATVADKVPTSSSVKCALQHASTLSYACTATVTDAAAGAPAPTGTVTFSGAMHGSFRPGKTCTLQAAGASSHCSVTYVPVPGQQTVSASYGGDAAHGSSVSQPTAPL